MTFISFPTLPLTKTCLMRLIFVQGHNPPKFCVYIPSIPNLHSIPILIFHFFSDSIPAEISIHECFIPQHSHHRCQPPHSELFGVLEQIVKLDVLFCLIQCTSSVYIITNESGWHITNIRSSICWFVQICTMFLFTQTSWGSYSSVSNLQVFKPSRWDHRLRQSNAANSNCSWCWICRYIRRQMQSQQQQNSVRKHRRNI